MSVKQQFAKAIESLPETVSIEEAFARLYRAFRFKQMLSRQGPPSRPDRAAYDAVFARKLPVLRFSESDDESALELKGADLLF